MLVRYEWAKTWKRPAFYITLGLVFFIDAFGFGYGLVRSLRGAEGQFTLPGQWPRILGESANVPLVFAGIVVVLLVASEFSWRTARQNVIDGLSRSEWYWGKVLIGVAVVALFVLLHVGLGGILARIGTPAGASGLFTSIQASALGGLVLAGAGYAVSAVFVSSLVRRSGGAVAIWLFYVVAAEGLLVAGLGRLWESGRPYLAYAPVRSFERARDYLMYDPDALARARARSAEMGFPPPEVGEPATVVAASAAWVVGLALAGWLLFRRRDL
ncbi:MAG: ABC transporter permease [Gemmatimonadota bacterium]